MRTESSSGTFRAAVLATWLLGVLLCSGAAGRSEGASDATGPAVPVIAHLQYREVDFAPLCVEVKVERDVRFEREPAFVGQHVFRGRMVLDSKTNQFLPFAWDIQQRRLFLDLNLNGDLTDDPAGVSTASGGSVQLFRGMRLRFPSGANAYDVLVDAHVFEQSGTARVFLYVRSLWEGAVALNGKRWYLAVIDRPDGQIGPPASFKEIGDRMILRPWDERDRPSLWWHATLGYIHDLSHVKLVNFPFRYAGNAEVFDAFALPAKLFAHGQAYRLEYVLEGQGKIAVTFRPLQVVLGKLQLAGEHIRRVVLDGGADGLTAVLDSPADAVEVPRGVYPRQTVLLQRPGFTNVAAGLGTNQLVLTESTSAQWSAGGPLRNMVGISPRPASGELSLDYQLSNASGIQFRLTSQAEKAPPGLEIRQGDSLIEQDRFRFG